MSSDGDSDVNPESVNTGVFPCSHPVSSQVKPKTGRLTEAEKLRQDAILNVNIDPLVYPKTISRRHHVSRKSLFQPSQDDTSMSDTGIVGDTISKEIEKQRLQDTEWELIPILPGQTVGNKKYPTREVFEYVYTHFTEPECHRYLSEIQDWLKFIRQHNKDDISLPVLDNTGKEYPQLINWTLHDIDSLPANVAKLQEIQDKSNKQKHLSKVVPTVTGTSTTPIGSSTQQTSQTQSKSSTQTSLSQSLSLSINPSLTGSAEGPPNPPPRRTSQDLSDSPDSSPDRMPSL